jgi:hypothetical protein
MKTTILAATLAMLISGPVFAAEPGSVSAATSAAVNVEHVKTAQPPSSHKAALEASAPQQYVGPFEVHDGLLPNGLAPNPFNYG